MPEDPAFDVADRRLPLYAYLEGVVSGRRVLELGSAGGAGADHLAALGAARVMSVDGDRLATGTARARYRRPNLEFRTVAVTNTGLDVSAIADRFDVVIVPDADALVRRPEVVAAWQRLLGDGGRLVVAAGNTDRVGASEGVGYYELADALAAHFPHVQMLGVTPFLGVGLVEFDGALDGIRIDPRLVKEGSEPPAAYVAIGGAEPAHGLGYALVQLPFRPLEARLAGSDSTVARSATDTARARLAEAEARVADLGRRLDEAATQAESAHRIARAQADEIDELRARIRRSVEDRGGIDEELARLRRALADADEAVMTLTRRTAEEMAAVAERLAVGLRAPDETDSRVAGVLAAARDEADRARVDLAEAEARAAASERRLEEIGGVARERQAALDDTLERLRLAESELARARRESARLASELQLASAEAGARAAQTRALAERDERVACLEGEKQELSWRLAELEERLRQTIARSVLADAARGESRRGEAPAAPPAAAAPPSDAPAVARARALEDFHKVSAAHMTEVTELRASVVEQAALVAEIEDVAAAAEARAARADAEAGALRKTAKDLEEADRSRRSRLAELEGKLLRLEHERRAGQAAAGDERAHELGALADERDRLRADVDRLTRAAARADDARAAAEIELAGLRARAAAGASDPAAGDRNGHGAPPPAALGSPDLLASLLGNYRQHAGRLRDDLENVRRRLDSLSSAEIARFFEELGDDLAEMKG